MDIQDVASEEVKWLTNGNEQAGHFLMQWRAYVHAIDDIIDGDTKTSEGILETFMRAAFLYSDPFYLANLAALRQIAVNCTNGYADSVLFEKSDEAWKREFADTYRHFGAEMVIAVAGICGGYRHMREVSQVLRKICYDEHHDAKGKPV